MVKTVRKADAFEIANHWVLAGSFFLLAISGFGFLFHLDPVFAMFGGNTGMRNVHNWAGIVFSLSLALSTVHYLPISLAYSGEDIVWLLKGGGYLSKRTTVPPQDKLNAGQKGYYLFVLLSGTAIAVSGFVIWLYPVGSSMRSWIQVSHLIHNISFVLMVVSVPTHIYLATLANPGTFRIMISGTVPLEWARKRHGRWIQKLGM
jgi:formate dehydrogenase subunit gamma